MSDLETGLWIAVGIFVAALFILAGILMWKAVM